MTARRAPGDGSISQRPDGLWVARLDVTRPGRPRRRKVGYAKTRAGAQRKLAEMKRERDAYGLGPDTVPTVAAWMQMWLDEICAERVRPLTLAGYRSKVKMHIVPSLGQHRLDKLRPEHVRGMLTGMKESGRSQNMRHQTYAVLRKALEDAVREEKAPRNVAKLVDPPGQFVPEITALTNDENAAVLRVIAGTRMESRWLAALALGLRQGEALGLGWEHVDLDAGTLTVARALARIDGRLVMQEPKSRMSKRTIPLPSFVAESLRLRRAQWETEPRDSEWRQFGLVWGQPNGRPRDSRADNREWQDVLDAAGITRRVRLHDARHSAASILAALGVPLPVMSAILGHSQISMTMRYVHTDLAAMQAAMQLVHEHHALERPALLQAPETVD